MAVLFPASPAVLDVYTEDNRQWTWDGTAWYSSVPAVAGQPSDPDLTAVAALSGAGVAVRTAPDTWALRSVAAGTGISVANGDGAAGNPTVSVNSDVVLTTRNLTVSDGIAGGGTLAADRNFALTGQALAFHNFAGTGLLVRTGAATYVARTIVGGDGIDVALGDGVAGPPVIAVDSSVVRTTRNVSTGTGLTGGGNLSADRTLALTGQALALHNLATSGLIARTAASTYATRQVVAGDGLDVTNGNGVSGDPTLAVDSTVARTTTSITAGNGLTGGGTIAATRDLAIGTPTSVTTTSTNTVTADSHTHALTLTEANIRTLIAEGTEGQIGTYAYLGRASGAIVYGNTYAGSGLYTAGVYQSSGAADTTIDVTESGTWRAMGYCPSVGDTVTTLFLRIS
jgi:trimeric autotransporter adhesin